jgi:SPRY domain
MLGFAPSKFYDRPGIHFPYKGWYLRLCNGILYYSTGRYTKGEAYSIECEVGDIVTCIYDASTSEISYEKNCVSLGVAFAIAKIEDIAPVVEDAGDSVTTSRQCYE